MVLGCHGSLISVLSSLKHAWGHSWLRVELDFGNALSYLAASTLHVKGFVTSSAFGLHVVFRHLLLHPAVLPVQRLWPRDTLTLLVSALCRNLVHLCAGGASGAAAQGRGERHVVRRTRKVGGRTLLWRIQVSNCRLLFVVLAPFGNMPDKR